MIADRAEINEGLIYKHFKSKEDLYLAILDTRNQDGFDPEDFQKIMEEDDNRKVFMYFARAYLTILRSNEKLVRLISFGQLASPDLAAPKIFRIPFDGSDQSPVFILSNYIKRRIKEGAFTRKKPKLTARIFVGMIHWYGLRRMIANSKQWGVYDEDEVLDAMVSIFLDGLIVRDRKRQKRGGTRV